MKFNRIFAAVLVFTMMLCVGCGSGDGNSSDVGSIDESQPEDSAADTVKPRISLAKDARSVIINQGEELDLMDGVKGHDNVDGDITHKIEINDGGFDPDVPGEYMITYFLADGAGNSANAVTRKVTVRQTTVLERYPVWEGDISGEIKNPESPPVFGGAWYHKAVSSKDKWIGIEATVTLPELDINRYSESYDESLDVDPGVKNLDNPSVYLGGNATYESDVGLSLSRALISTDGSTLSTGCIAFRPFWRYITATDKDEGGYDAHGGEYAVSANGNNCIANYHWKYTQYYYLPGDTLRIIVYSPEANKLQMQIEVISKSTLPSSVAMREKYGWSDPQNFISPIFSAPGFGSASSEFKRVNAIDQVSNEGGTAIPTDTTVTGAVWQEVYLYRIIDGETYRVPMTEDRRAETSAPYASAFTVSYEGVDTSLGGEKVDIHP